MPSVDSITRQHHEASGFRAGLGIVGLITVVALTLSLLLTPAERDPVGNGTSSLSGHKYEESSIHGSMTLEMVEEATGVPAAYIIESLKLPGSISTEKPLGLLKREHRFKINDIREAVREYNTQK